MELTIEKQNPTNSVNQLLRKSELLVKKSEILQQLYYCNTPEEKQKLWAKYNSLKQL